MNFEYLIEAGRHVTLDELSQSGLTIDQLLTNPSALDNVNMMQNIYVWLDLPGAHPLKVNIEVVRKNDLELHIVRKHKRLKQIKAYQKRGFVRSLACCCDTTEELIAEIDDMPSCSIQLFVE